MYKPTPELIDPSKAMFNARSLAGITWIALLVFLAALFFELVPFDGLRIGIVVIVAIIAVFASAIASPTRY